MKTGGREGGKFFSCDKNIKKPIVNHKLLKIQPFFFAPQNSTTPKMN
jgi:hypothetical protein